VHFLSVFVLLLYFFIADIFSARIALFILVLILIVLIELEYMRIEVGRRIPLLSDLWRYMRRTKEKDRLGGDVFFLIGAILVLSIFDVKIAIAAILMTTFGDLSAAVVGSRFGYHKLPFFKEMSWEGSLAELAVDFLIAFFVFFNPFVYGTLLLSNYALWGVVIVMAVTATVVETLVYKLDDNLMIPVFAGFNGQMIFYILSYINKII